MNRFSRFLLAVLFLFALPLCALAQDARINVRDLEELSSPTTNSYGGEEAPQENRVVNPYDPKYRPLHYKPDMTSSPLSPYGYTLRFVRPATAEKETATLRIYHPVLANGCLLIDPLAPEVEVNGHGIWITIPEAVVGMDKGKNNPHYACDQKSKMVFIDVPLRLSDFKANGIKTVTLRMNKAGQEKYSVEYDDQKIRLLPDRNVYFKPAAVPYGQDALTYWFYPENTVIAEVPTAKGGDVFWEIEQWALKHDLVPLDMNYREFLQPSQNNRIYYIDQSGRTAALLTRDKMSPIGHIVLRKAWYGPNGMYEKGKPIQITAKRPGLYE